MAKHHAYLEVCCFITDSRHSTLLRFHSFYNNLHKFVWNSYEIDLTPEFKYKKFIRSKVLEDFNYKNKDIFIIKSINNYKNYHNYIVVLKNKSVRHKQYPNMISSVSDSYKWRQIYGMYNPAKMTPDVKDFKVKDGYKYLGEKSLRIGEKTVGLA